MKKRISSYKQLGMLILMLIAIYVGTSNACTFVGIVRAPDATFDPHGDYGDFMNHLAFS
jgi:hypothetical protein